VAEDVLQVGILETGRPPEELARRYGDYPAMVACWLGLPAGRHESYPVLENALPDSPLEKDLWVITGSKCAVYEDHAWIPPLEGFIRAARAAGSRMIGICFGHQIIARALGGQVEKSSKGWGLGLHEYAPLSWPRERLGPAPGVIRLHAFHQDQVTEAPAEARCIARSDFCEHAALLYPGFALTVQAHPEFSAPFLADLLQMRRGSPLPPEDVDRALGGLSAAASDSWLAHLILERNRRF